MASFSHMISTIDLHTAGEPTRVILSGLPKIPAGNIIEKQLYFRKNLDKFRSALMNEPRGHRNMFGAVLTMPSNPEADWDIFFIDSCGNDVEMCGHAIIGAAVMLVQVGMVEIKEPETEISFTTVKGIVKTHVVTKNGMANYAWFENVPAYLYASDVNIKVEELGSIQVDFAYGGNLFCIVSEEQLRTKIELDNIDRLLELSSLLRNAINCQIKIKDPITNAEKKIELIQIVGNPKNTKAHERNVVIGKGSLDRSPCGTGTSARMSLLYEKGKLKLNEEFVNESIIGTLFFGKLVRRKQIKGLSTFIPVIGGEAFITGIHQFVIDPEDPLKYGFII